MDMALTIVESPNASAGQKALAGGYFAAEVGLHVLVVAGTAVVGCAVASPGCAAALGAGGSSTASAAGTVATVGTAATAACADGDCTNEVRAVGQTVANAACADGDCTNEATTAAQTAQQAFQLSKHALQRMAQRGVTLEQVQTTISNSKPFQYFHEGVWKTGFYDPVTKIFVGQAGETVTTVIANVKPQYIENLQKVAP
jgi:hypothetical protein